MTAVDRALLEIVPGDAPPEEWHAGRDGGVTASQVHEIAQGGRGTWKRILTDKLNGATFRGNAHTARGQDREAFLIEYAAGIAGHVTANRALFGHPDHPRHRATPDALGYNPDRGGFGVEVKSHDHGWARDVVPRDHYDQCQFGMWVTESEWWLYVWEVMGEDGEPTLDPPRAVWIPRDEHRITQLADEADRFLEWWDGGAPDADDLPAALEEALAWWADARSRKRAAEADERDATRVFREHIDATPGAAENGLKVAGTRAGFTYTVTESQVLDEDAWCDAEPDTYAAWLDLRARAAEVEKAALTLYHTTRRDTRLTPREAA